MVAIKTSAYHILRGPLFNYGSNGPSAGAKGFDDRRIEVMGSTNFGNSDGLDAYLPSVPPSSPLDADSSGRHTTCFDLSAPGAPGCFWLLLVASGCFWLPAVPRRANGVGLAAASIR